MLVKITLLLVLIVVMLSTISCAASNSIVPGAIPTPPNAIAAPSPTALSTRVAPLSTTASLPRSSPTPPHTPTPFDQTNIEKIDRDLTYCSIQGVALKLDLYIPNKSTDRPLPVAVNIHGGSWSVGDKARSDSAADIPEFIDRGYVVAALNYRLAPGYQFPAQIQDVKCAIRFLRANAKTYNLDPNRIGAWGCSAGGQLAALLGLTDANAGFDQGEYLKESSRVEVVATLSAPMDLTLYDATARAEMLQKVFGTSTDAKILAQASPVNYASKNAAPFLLFQGNADRLITPRHGEKLVERLTAVGVSVNLITVQNGTHCFPPDATSNPKRAEITTLIVNFFDQYLRR